MMAFIKRAAVVWACAGALLLAWSGLGYGITIGARAQYDDELVEYQEQAHFWRMVAGTEPTRSGVLDRLARDLHDLETAQEVNSFKGDSNRYGGITEELGFDPFAGVNCSECGPLDTEFANDVVAVKTGHIDDVLGPAPVEPSGGTEPPKLLWPAWIISLPLAAFIWKRRNERKYAAMPHEARLLRELDDTLGELRQGTPEYNEIDALRRNLRVAVDRRITFGEDEKNSLRIDDLKREAGESLAAITEGNRVLDR